MCADPRGQHQHLMRFSTHSASSGVQLLTTLLLTPDISHVVPASSSQGNRPSNPEPLSALPLPFPRPHEAPPRPTLSLPKYIRLLPLNCTKRL